MHTNSHERANVHESPSAPVTRRISGLGAVVRAAAIWLGIYLFICVLPLIAFVWGELPAGRGFWIEFGVALGMIGFGMLVAQCLTTARLKWIAPGVGSDAELMFHRRAGILAFLLVMAHPVILIITLPSYLEYFDPSVNFLRAVFLIAAVAGLILLVVLPLWRMSFGMSYEWWRLTHGLFTVGVLVVGIVHAIQVGYYANTFWKQAAWTVIGAVGIVLVGHSRLVKPFLIRRKPYRVAEVRNERGTVYSLVLEADGHAGLTFIAGQYAWITIGDSPFVLQQHPFTISSSDVQSKRIEFAIKEFGDFSSSIKHTPPGTRVLLEGPYGAFTLEANPAIGGFFVAGGIGVTPFLSMLRSCLDRDDQRPLVLIYANETWDDIAFREELNELQKGLNLKLVYVLRKPPPWWNGETGYVTRELIERYLPAEELHQFHFYTCGPEPLMNAASSAFTKLGVPPWRKASERFQVV